MIIKEAEKKVLSYLNEFKIATTDTLADLFYPSLRYAQHRLKQMYDNKLLKRDRDHFTAQYYYYITKPRQLRHSLLVTHFYRELNKIADIEYFRPEFTHFEGIRPDAFIAYELQGEKDMAFLEVEISNNGLDIEKYERLYKLGEWKGYNFPKFPNIIAITDKNIPNTKLKIIQISEEISNLREVL